MNIRLYSKGLRYLGRAIRIAAVLAYIIWFAVGFCILSLGQVVGYVAVHSLPVGYRLHSHDFKFDFSLHDLKSAISKADFRMLLPGPDPVGKYLLRRVEENKPFTLNDLSAAPLIQVSAGKCKYFFPLKDDQTDLEETLNTDSYVDICSRTCIVEKARVASIVCGEAPSTKCSVVLELPTCEDKLSGQGGDQYRLIPRN